MNELTALLEKVSSGTDPKAPEELLNAVYNQLRIIAHGKMRDERPNHTLQATILANDAWLSLFPVGSKPKFTDRTHFFRAAARAMRRSLVDHSRRRSAQKRGKHVDVSDTQLAEFVHEAPDELIQAVDEALNIFATKHPSIVELIELRFCVGMTMEEAAKTLGMPKRTAERGCASFSAWFRSKYKEEFTL